MIRGIATVARLTLHEAARRRILLATFLCGMAFLTLYAIGLHFIVKNANAQGGSFVQRGLFTAFITLAGLYAVNFLTVMTAVLLPVDTISGEIASGVMQTLAAKPIRRSEIVLGKWIAHVLLVAAYLVLMAGGVLAIARAIGGVLPPRIHLGLPLMLLEGVVLVSLSIAGGTRFSTVTNGVMAFGLYGLAFIGSWVEQIGTFTDNVAARNVGTVSSLVMPSEALWNMAAYQMQPTIMRELNATPFSPVSVPSTPMVVYAGLYALLVLASGVRAFSKRGL